MDLDASHQKCALHLDASHQKGALRLRRLDQSVCCNSCGVWPEWSKHKEGSHISAVFTWCHVGLMMSFKTGDLKSFIHLQMSWSNWVYSRQLCKNVFSIVALQFQDCLHSYSVEINILVYVLNIFRGETKKHQKTLPWNLKYLFELVSNCLPLRHHKKW